MNMPQLNMYIKKRQLLKKQGPYCAAKILIYVNPDTQKLHRGK